MFIVYDDEGNIISSAYTKEDLEHINYKEENLKEVADSNKKLKEHLNKFKEI